jgi:hypothetical protein
MKTNFGCLKEFSSGLRALILSTKEAKKEIYMRDHFSIDLVYWFGAFVQMLKGRGLFYLENS